jgi:endonuclease/exonuclease/phosphatase (EEP) superfamily protein YafD
LHTSARQELREEWIVESLRGEKAVALGGDLNTWLRGSRAGAVAVLREAFALPETPPARPNLVAPFAPDVQADHLFFRLPPGWSAAYRVVDDAYGSDHRPLLGWVRVPGSEAALP